MNNPGHALKPEFSAFSALIALAKLKIYINEHTHPLKHSARQDEKVPDKMRNPGFHRKRNYSKGINYSAPEYIKAKPGVVCKHFRHEHNSAPAENNVKRYVNKSKTRRPENTDKAYSRDNYRPLNYEETRPNTPPIYESNIGAKVAPMSRYIEE